MFFEYNRRQKSKIVKGSYSEKSRVRITQLVIEDSHLKAIEAIHKKKNCSKSYILEEMLKYSLLYKKINIEAIIREKRIPKKNKIYYVGSHTIHREVLSKIRVISEQNETTLSVVIWHLLTLFFESYPLYLQEEYQGNLYT